MGVFDFLNKRKLRSILTDNPNGYEYESEHIGNIIIPDKLTDINAFKLANTVSEIYFPIDFYADRCSKLRYYIADKSGKEVTNTELNRFVGKINPFYSFNDLVYQYVFSYMSDGNAITYLGIPDTYKAINVSSIDRVDILQPDLLSINEYFNVSILKVKTLNDLIRQARYDNYTNSQDLLDVAKLRIDRIDSTRKDYSQIFARSPLFKSIHSINTLLAVYSARYNVYVNNGAAGYLVKKVGGANDPLNTAINDPSSRETILKDINNRNGITGGRNLWGISSIPLEFVKTLASISELMPLEETLENSIKIASVWQIPPGLVPRKDQATYKNGETDERVVWENGIISMVNTVCDNFTEIFTLSKQGYSIKADYSNVSCLKLNESVKEDVITKKVANLTAIKTAYPEKLSEINKEFDKIIADYGN
ncbi:MAG TPA: phage portal protein [Candidatus Paceibacterota bacterium]